MKTEKQIRKYLGEIKKQRDATYRSLGEFIAKGDLNNDGCFYTTTTELVRKEIRNMEKNIERMNVEIVMLEWVLSDE